MTEVRAVATIEPAAVAAGFRATLEDEVAFRRWYDDALPRVYGYLFERTGRVRSVAEEITQETFVELVRSRRRFDGRSDPVTWTIAIARHRLADHFRRLEREDRRRTELLHRADPFQRSDEAWPAMERHDVHEALRRLAPMQRAAITLRYMDDLSVTEVAAVLGRSEHATESLLARGREALRRSLRRDDEVNDG